jgi:hypothetical protein
MLQVARETLLIEFETSSECAKRVDHGWTERGRNCPVGPDADCRINRAILPDLPAINPTEFESCSASERALPINWLLTLTLKSSRIMTKMTDTERIEYEVSAINKVVRAPERAVYDRDTVHSIVRAAPLVHMGFVDSQGLPQVVPMVAALEETDIGEVFVYLHGWATARFVRLTEDPDTPITITATHVDGFVAALSAFHHS